MCSRLERQALRMVLVYARKDVVVILENHSFYQRMFFVNVFKIGKASLAYGKCQKGCGGDP